jgi:hypothetical protein
LFTYRDLDERFRRDPDPLFLRGTLAPFFLASDSPIAIACLRLFTLPPFPPGPLRRVPFFFRRIALFTALPAPALYRRVDFFLVAAMMSSLCMAESNLYPCTVRGV